MSKYCKKNTKMHLKGGKREFGRTDYELEDEATYDYNDSSSTEHTKSKEREQEADDVNAIIADELKKARAARRLSLDELDDEAELPVHRGYDEAKVLTQANVNSVELHISKSPAIRKSNVSADAKTNDSPGRASDDAESYIFSVGGAGGLQSVLVRARVLIERILRTEKYESFSAKVAAEKVISDFEFSDSKTWQIPQSKSIFMMRLIQIGLEKDRCQDVADLCEALYAEGRLTKQQVRRGLVRLTNQFEQMVELDNPKAATALGGLLVILKDKNLISAKTLTVLNADFIRDKLIASSDAFCKAFEAELAVIIDGRESYEDRIDELLQHFFGIESKDTTDLRTFFAQDVIINKWGVFNWLFIKRVMELVLQQGPKDRDLLPVLFDKVATTKSGFTAADFGYAFDYMIQNSKILGEVFSTYSERAGNMIAEALDAEIVPLRYLLDAETYTQNEDDSSEEAQEQLLRAIVQQLQKRRQVQPAVDFGSLAAESGFNERAMKKRRYSARVSL